MNPVTLTKPRRAKTISNNNARWSAEAEWTPSNGCSKRRSGVAAGPSRRGNGRQVQQQEVAAALSTAATLPPVSAPLP